MGLLGNGDICSHHGKTAEPKFDASVGRDESCFGNSGVAETIAFLGDRCSLF
jgi:hypothetical protein